MQTVQLIDRITDALPVVSTLTNGAIIAYKIYHYFFGSNEEIDPASSPWQYHAVQKENLPCLIGLVPVIGNIIHLINMVLEEISQDGGVPEQGQEEEEELKIPWTKSFKIATWDINTEHDNKTTEESTRELNFLLCFNEIVTLAEIICLQGEHHFWSLLLDESKYIMQHKFEKCEDNNTAIVWRNDLFTKWAEKRLDNRLIVLLQHKETSKIFAVASARLAPCHPLNEEEDHKRGDDELDQLLTEIFNFQVDGYIIGLNAQVCKSHERLQKLEDNGLIADVEEGRSTYLSSTLGDRKFQVDYIFIAGSENCAVEISNPEEKYTFREPGDYDYNPSSHSYLIKEATFSSAY